MNLNIKKPGFIQCGSNRYINPEKVLRIEWHMNNKMYDVHVSYGRYEETYTLSFDEFDMFREELENNAV